MSKRKITAYKLRDEVVEQFEQQTANVNKLCDEIAKLEAKKAACQAKVMKLVDGHTGLMVRCIRCGEHKADLNGSWQCVNGCKPFTQRERDWAQNILETYAPKN